MLIKKCNNCRNQEDSLSTSSSNTVTYQETALTNVTSQQPNEMEESTASASSSVSALHRSSTLTLEKDVGVEKTTERTPRIFARRLSNASTTTMTKVRNSAEQIYSKSDPVQYTNF